VRHPDRVVVFQERHGLKVTRMVSAADAGMLSASNLTELDAAGCQKHSPFSRDAGGLRCQLPFGIEGLAHVNGRSILHVPSAAQTYSTCHSQEGWSCSRSIR
jgi:hypothetical protein